MSDTTWTRWRKWSSVKKWSKWHILRDEGHAICGMPVYSPNNERRTHTGTPTKQVCQRCLGNAPTRKDWT